MSTPAPFTTALSEEIEMFYVAYDDALAPVLEACAAGKITVDQQVEQSEVIWNGLMAQAIQSIVRLVEQAVPEPMPKFQNGLVNAQVALGWNHCRDAMLAAIKEQK